MTQFLNDPANRAQRPKRNATRSSFHWMQVVVALGISATACSEGPASSGASTQGGSGGQVTAGASGNAAVAGGGSAGTGGAPPAAGGGGGGATPTLGGTSGAAGTAGGSGGAAGTAGGGGAGGTAGSSGAGGTAGSGGANDGWVPLFNGTDLTGWKVEGTNDTLFTVQAGEIHVYPTQPDQSTQPQADLRYTTKLGPKYILHVEYKWGQTRFSDRKQTARDAGVLFHISGDVTKVWPDSIECQMGSSALGGEWVTGDLWALGSPTTAQTKDANGQLHTYGAAGAVSHTTVHADKPQGEWNIVEVTINGADDAVYVVNGIEANHVYNMKYNGQPLTDGYVGLEAEYSEAFYRNVWYKPNQ